MTAPAPSDDAAHLMTALAEAASLLEAGDAQGAEQAMARVVGRCPSLAAGGLGAEGAAVVRGLLDRCRQAGAQLHGKLSAELAQTGTARKAHNAYGG
jgi:hypothetical protein